MFRDSHCYFSAMRLKSGGTVPPLQKVGGTRTPVPPESYAYDWSFSASSAVWSYYTPYPEKRVWGISGITLSNTGRFLKFFHCYNLQDICNKVVVKYPTTP